MLFTRKIGFLVFVAATAVWVICCYNPFLLWFQNDDFSHILLSKKGVFFQKNSFRPVCDLSIMLDYYLWKGYAPGYHITNLTLHILCTALVFCFSRRVFSMYNSCLPFYAAGCSLLFFAYPFHSEAVFWILGRSAILGAIFSLVFLLFFLKEKKSMLDAILCLSAYAIALLTYESSWVVPLLAFVLAKNEPGRPFSENIKPYSPLAAIFVIYLFARYKVNNEIVGAYEGINFLHFNIVTLLGNFLKLFAMGFAAYTETPVVLSIAFILLCPVLVFVITKRFTPLMLKLIICLLISLLPYLSLGIDTHGTEGERFLYLPSVFGMMLTVIIIASIQKKSLRFVVACVAAILYAAQLYVTAVNYRFAGSVVKQTITQVNSMPAGKNIIIEGLPKSQHGALILESGLQDAAMLLAPGKTNSIHIASWRYELDALQMPYRTIVEPSTKGATLIKYVFTDSALLIYK